MVKKSQFGTKGAVGPLAISHPPETYLTTSILFNSRVIGKQKAKNYKRKSVFFQLGSRVITLSEFNRLISKEMDGDKNVDFL